MEINHSNPQKPSRDDQQLHRAPETQTAGSALPALDGSLPLRASVPSMPQAPLTVDRDDPTFGRTLIELLKKSWPPNKRSADEEVALASMLAIFSEELATRIKAHPKVAKAYEAADEQYKIDGGFRGVFYGPSIQFGCFGRLANSDQDFFPVVVGLSKFSIREISSDKLPREVLGIPIHYKFWSGWRIGRFSFGSEYYRDSAGVVEKLRDSKE